MDPNEQLANFYGISRLGENLVKFVVAEDGRHYSDGTTANRVCPVALYALMMYAAQQHPKVSGWSVLSADWVSYFGHEIQPGQVVSAAWQTATTIPLSQQKKILINVQAFVGVGSIASANFTLVPL